MTLPGLIDALDSRGVSLGLRLVVDAPEGAVDAGVLDALAEHRPALLVKLARKYQWAELKDQTWAKDSEGRPENLGSAADDPSPPLIPSRGALLSIVGYLFLCPEPIGRDRAVELAAEQGVSSRDLDAAANLLGIARTIEDGKEVWSQPVNQPQP
ncbi:MAG: hypothetical protein P4L85_19550 [Paludisphaera borealis]|uniref:hypothetical protein n=1 Tax=Paludisphaera borealis TaxID=1387353 RepID=UPI00284E7537|nr:hypothetical protein [Paludisphaera borealis]MDR3621556.1 hypothetical protein [Paludisphaera borealis]